MTTDFPNAAQEAADRIKARRAEDGSLHGSGAEVPTASMATRSGWVTVALPGGCGGWNDGHDCGREDDHPGDHVCAGCHDQWNRGPWDDDADEWEHDRPDERCIDDGGAA